MSNKTLFLLPCPFCGGRETSTYENWTFPQRNGKRSLVSYDIYHSCDIPADRPEKPLRIVIYGRDRADAAAKWNMRSEEAKS